MKENNSKEQLAKTNSNVILKKYNINEYIIKVYRKDKKYHQVCKFPFDDKEIEFTNTRNMKNYYISHMYDYLKEKGELNFEQNKSKQTSKEENN